MTNMPVDSPTLPLTYPRSRTSIHRRRARRRFLLIGPAAGALVGAIDVLSGVALWLHFRRPDSYLADWVWVEITFVITVLGGALVGTFFGGAVVAFEWVSRRCVATGPFLLVVPLLGMAVFGAAHYFELRDDTVGGGMTSHFVVVVLSSLAAVAFSRRRTRRPSPAALHVR